MMTAKENMRAVIRGENPERFVNQYEALSFVFDPYLMNDPSPEKGGSDVKDSWGVLYSWPNNAPAGFPVHKPDTIVVQDIEDWKEYVKHPNLEFSQEQWDIAIDAMNAIDNTKAFRTAFVAPGLFEQTHHLCSIQEALMYYITDEDEMHDLTKYLLEFELKHAELICDKLHPEALFRHDDWGGEKSTFMSPAMFEEFFLEPTKEIYKYYHDHGVELTFHHSDSYAATLVPDMIEMGIDVWQGPMRTNNVPELVKKYGGQITFMGDIDNKLMDFEGWTQADCDKAARDSMESCGINYFIPCITQGGPGSVYPGAYKALCDSIDNYNKEKFGVDVDENFRVPMQILF